MKHETISLSKIVRPENPMPKLAHADFQNLFDSIKERGVEEPLVLGPAAPDGTRELLDGWHRFAAAQIVNLKEVPFVEASAADAKAPAEFALRRALERRNLTAAGRALCVFMAHEREAVGRLGTASPGRPKKTIHRESFTHPEEDLPVSLRELAARFDVSQRDLSIIAKAKTKLPEAGWAAFQEAVVEGASAGAALAGAAGKLATAGAPKRDVNHSALWVNGSRSMVGVFQHWDSIPEEMRVRGLENLREAMAEPPPEVVGLIEDAAMTQWTPAMVARVRKACDQRLKSEKQG